MIYIMWPNLIKIQGYLFQIYMTLLYPWSRKWQHVTVFFPGKFNGQRSLVGFSPWGHKGLDTTE